MLKFSKQGFNSAWTENLQIFKLDLEKTDKPEIKLPTSTGSSKKKESFRKTAISALLTMPKPLTAYHNKLWKIQEMGIPDHLTASWEIRMQVKKQQVELNMEQQTGSK